MSFNTFLGPAAPELGWVPAPRYLLRRDRIQRIMKNVPIGRLLEIGPGAGALLVEFSNRGFKCEALESSPEAQKLTKEFMSKFDCSLPINESEHADWDGQFDVICVFDVLEHIENDREVLEKWSSWLKPGGTFLLSVPAHMKSWNSRDIWAGHYRRYEKEGLIDLIEKAGYSIERFECYGFPLANLTEVLGNPFYSLNVSNREKSGVVGRKRGTELSGTDRTTDLKFYPFLKSFVGKVAIWIFVNVQRLFLSTDMGNGYIVKAIKH
ncbi:MAG: class I SAM-dependent methyltransferase [Methylococcales bacterium]|nr:class I SAM-dependent methyltransferase [Methylococcales bacterium]